MLHITGHAIERYQDRVENLPEAEIKARLCTPLMEAAARFGDCKVKLPTGHRAVIVAGAIVTVTPIPSKGRRNKGVK